MRARSSRDSKKEGGDTKLLKLNECKGWAEVSFEDVEMEQEQHGRDILAAAVSKPVSNSASKFEPVQVAVVSTTTASQMKMRKLLVAAIGSV